MARKESGFINMVAALFVVTFIASSALAIIHELTKEPIARSKMEKKENAITGVVPNFNNDPVQERKEVEVDNSTLYLYFARMGNEVTGIAVETYTYNGFSGLIRLMVGFLPDGTINGIAVLEHLETPGLGDKIENLKSYDKSTGRSWSSQFQGKHPANFTLKVKKDNGDVDAITAATITSRAYCDAVRKAYEGFRIIKEKSGADFMPDTSSINDSG